MLETKRKISRRLWSISWPIVQVYSLTIEYQVCQFVPSFSISEQFESILVTIPPRNSILLLWNDGHQDIELILCRVVESSWLPSHNIVLHISWHDLPYHRTTKKYQNSRSMEVFSSPAEIRDSNMVLLLSTRSLLTWHCPWVHPRYTWSRKDVDSPKSTSLLSTCHIGEMFCFFPANYVSSTNTDKNNPFCSMYEQAFSIGNLLRTVFL